MKWTQDESAAPVEPSDNWQNQHSIYRSCGPVNWSLSGRPARLTRISASTRTNIDEDFGMEPAPMDTTGGTIAAVAVSDAAIWGSARSPPRDPAQPPARGYSPSRQAAATVALLIVEHAGEDEPQAHPPCGCD